MISGESGLLWFAHLEMKSAAATPAPSPPTTTQLLSRVSDGSSRWTLTSQVVPLIQLFPRRVSGRTDVFETADVFEVHLAEMNP